MKQTTLPNSWTTRPLGECGEWISGGTPSKSRSEYWNGDIPWFSAKSLKTFDLVDAEDRVTELGAKDGTTVAPPGTILFVVRGMSLANEFRVGITSGRATLNQDLRGIIAAADVDPRYLARFMRQSPDIIAQVDNASHGTKRIETERLKSVRVPLPPLTEQKRIADILDKADAIRRKRREALLNVDRVPDSYFMELFGSPLREHPTWPTKSLAELLDGIDSGWSPVCDDTAADDSEWGVLKLGAVTTCRYLDSENKRLPATLSPRQDLEIKPGDLLVSRKNTYDLVAACVWVQTTRPRLMLSDLVFRLRVRQSAQLCPAYLWGVFTHRSKRRQIQRLASGSAGSMPNISKARLMSLPVVVPPLTLQQEYAKALTHTSQLKERMRNDQSCSDVLFNSLVQRAFRAEL